MKKYCFLLSYAGENYNGCQRQRSEALDTIEEHVLKALYKNGWISEYDYHYCNEIEFERASRTDRGVSALRQCISLLLGKLLRYSP